MNNLIDPVDTMIAIDNLQSMLKSTCYTKTDKQNIQEEIVKLNRLLSTFEIDAYSHALNM